MAIEMSLLQFVTHLDTLQRNLDRLGPDIIRHAAEAVCARARAAIGTYDFGWEPLKPATIAERVRQGFYPDMPLFRTGELQASINYTISQNGLEAQVGSDNPKALWHELGTSRVPARPFLVPAAHELEPKIQKAAAKAVVAVLIGGSLMSAASEMSELMELLHLGREAIHAFHSIQENIDRAVNADEDGNNRDQH